MADEPVDPVFEALWLRVEGAWEDDRTHIAALEHALRAQKLPELARRYRALGDDPRYADVSKSRLEAIVVAAMTMLEATKAPPRPRVPAAITWSAASVCAVVLAWLAWIVFGHGAP
jgi:hypothetical protein